MGAEDVDLITQAFDDLSRAGVEGLLPWVHPEFEMTTPLGLAAEPQTYRGREGVRRWFDSFYEVMDEVTLEPYELEDAGGGRILVLLTIRARGQSSGLETAQRTIGIYTLRDEMLARIDLYSTVEEARAALAEGGGVASE